MFAPDELFGLVTLGQNDTAEGSGDRFKTLLNHIEAELYRSDVFRSAIEGLEENQTEESNRVQFLLKTVGREAIRLALKQVLQPLASETQSVEAQPATGQAIEPPKPTAIDAEATLLNLVPGWRKRQAQVTPLEQAVCDREVALAQLGAKIRKAREARSMTLEALHKATLVPLHQLSAIEVGHGAHLPEDVYLRGFVRRIAIALNLNVEQLLDLIPSIDPVKAVLPTWYHPKTKSSPVNFGSLSLHPAHLYVGYAALVAGGFAWLSHQKAPTLPGAINLDSNRVVVPQLKTNHSYNVNANSTVSVMPPEMIR